MSRNLRGLSGRKGLAEGLYEEISSSAGEMHDAIADNFLTGRSTVLGVSSFYDFLGNDHLGRKAFVCDGTACLVSGGQEKVRQKLSAQYAEDEIGTVTCLGHCHSNDAFMVNGEIRIAGDGKPEVSVRVATNAEKPALLPEEGETGAYWDLARKYLSDSAATLAELELSGLRGRGGAGFPFHIKVRSSRDTVSDRKYVVCNADEGDPGAFSDKWLLEERPHAVLFGMLMTGLITGADAGYLDVTNPENIVLYNEYYGAEHPTVPGYRIPEMFAAAGRGDLKALWIMGEDILQTDPNTCHVRSSLQGLDFLVVQELFMTETARMADVIFPASSFFEKEGTFTNGERRIQRVQKVVEPLEGTKPDGQIVVDMMNRMGYPQEGYTADVILKEIAGIVPFFKGVKWDELGNNGKQWPVKEDGTDTQILHTETFKRGKGRFHSWDYDVSPELDEHAGRFPFILTTGRLLEHYNSGTMTRRTPNREIVTEDLLYVHHDDASAKGLTSGDYARIFSPRGVTTMKVKVTDVVKPGVVYTTFHFPEAAINFLTSGVGDEFTLTPEYKVVAVDFEKSLYGIFTRAECLSDIKKE